MPISKAYKKKLNQIIFELNLNDFQNGWDSRKLDVLFDSHDGNYDLISSISLNIGPRLKKLIFLEIKKYMIKEKKAVYDKLLEIEHPDSLNKLYRLTAVKPTSLDQKDPRILVVISEVPSFRKSKLKYINIEKKISMMKWIHSHQVRSPLSNVLGIVEILQDWENLSEDELKLLLKYLKESVTRMDEVIKIFVSL